MISKLLILKICAELQSIDYAACTTTLTAANMQTNALSYVDGTHLYLSRKAHLFLVQKTSRRFVSIVGYGIYLWRNKNISHNFTLLRNLNNALPVVTPSVGLDKNYSVSVNWGLHF